MFRKLLSLCLGIAITISAQAQNSDKEAVIDSVHKTFTYQSGTISLHSDKAKLTVPKGFKFLDAEQSRRVLVDLWGNPSDVTTEGMLFPEKSGPLTDKSFAFNITYDDMGYVKDEDADEIDYSDLLKDMQAGMDEENAERVKQGYESIHLIGWASEPFYDKDHKVLHWAKELQFGDSASANTLNYDVRILGRSGVMSMNAIASMGELPMVKQHIPVIVNSIMFESGSRYSDFTSGDKLAAMTIGGLVAGKVLAKVGFFALILKFWKVLIAAVVGGFSLIRKFLTGRSTASDVEEEPQV
ncbi:DUF2167 domain-containing protein [Spirosoma sp. HMF3257]|uniref:DUF2167 domain-containing protein n=1 Tax=Spirosoma telluris TaxID=2183553 RepID=A0A327NME9_9BACT|nr:DUF2167 domain-containing protein [Spirosoma telluris]RAI76520.1 DUF2167 domain-containing protein [Spirosoma telluris]